MKKFSLAFWLIAVASSMHGQLVWNFGAISGNASPVGVAAHLTSSSISQVHNSGTTTMLSSSSASESYLGASRSFNAAASALPGVLNPDTSTAFQFTLTPSQDYIVAVTRITFGTRSTGTGPTHVAVRSNFDDFEGDLATSVSLNGSWSLVSSPVFNAVIGTAADPLMIRIYGYGGTGAVGAANWRIDDVTVTFSVMSAVPEPSTYAAVLGSIALIGAGLIRRCRTKRSA